MNVHPGIFREYDVRGVVGRDLTADVALAVGRALGSELAPRGAPTAVVGHDNRPSSPELAEAVCRGLNETGVRAVLVGMVPTPVLYFAERELDADAGLQVTGSHNPPEYNGIKMVVDGRAIYGAEIQALRARVETDRYASGRAKTEWTDVLDRYVEAFVARARVPGSARLVLDCGNGAGSVVAPRALREVGAEVECLYCESDGTFPNHHPDPTVDENLRDLIARVRERGDGFGVGLDGDADRIGAITETGRIVRGDHLLILFALDLLPERPGARIVFDVKCSQAVPEAVREAGGEPVMWKTGHSLIKEKMRETGSPLAGEMSGHICFADRYFGFDDAIYATARLAELVARSGRTLEELAAEIPSYPSTPELRLECPDERKFQVVERAVERFRKDYEVVEVDGARILFPGGWALIRASNTQPVIVARIEADTPERLEEIRDEVADWLAAEGIAFPEPGRG